MNVQGIIRTQFEGCTIEELSAEQFEGSEAFGPYYVTYTGTLPLWSDVVAQEQDYLDYVALVNAKRAKKQQAVDKHAEKILEGFKYKVTGDNKSYFYQLDEASTNVANNFMTGLISGESNPHGGYYRSQDDKKVVMNDADLSAFLTAYGKYYGELRRALHDLKDAVADATTVNDVNAVDINGGWPANDG